MIGVGETIRVTRQARDLTQTGLAECVGLSQAAINRYEAGLREPDDATVDRIASALGVTKRFLEMGDTAIGAIAVDAHMRRQKTTKASIWRRLEAQLNVLRLQSAHMFEEVSMSAQYVVPTFDPYETEAEQAAALVRAQWRLPLGPVTNLTRRMEAAGCLIFEQDFGTRRVDGLSQWSGDHPVVLINEALPTDRKRLTLAHELGHLCLHSSMPTEDMELEAHRFAAALLMPVETIRPELRSRIDLGRLLDLKREWGVSMQAIFERANSMGLVKPADRAAFYRQLNARGWKTVEPLSETLAPEKPALTAAIGNSLRDRGLSDSEIAFMAGVVDPRECPFQPTSERRLRSV